MLNRVILIGRLTHDPELRYTNSGVAVTKFSLAVGRNYANQQGERETDFFNIVTWRGLAENCAKFIRKGSLVGLEGRLQVRKYENQEGRTIRVTEVIADEVRFLDSKKSQDTVSDYGANYGTGNNKFSPNDDPFASEGKPIDISDDDLPF